MLIPKMLYDSAQVGMAGALKAEGLSADPLEFTAAMAIASPIRTSRTNGYKAGRSSTAHGLSAKRPPMAISTLRKPTVPA